MRQRKRSLIFAALTFRHDQLHAIKMSLDKTFRTALGNADDTLKKVLTPRDGYCRDGRRERAVAESCRRCGAEESTRQREASRTQKGGIVNMIPIDELIEIWVEACRRRQVLNKDDLSWWREACQYLRPDWPPLEDDEIINEESGEQIN